MHAHPGGEILPGTAYYRPQRAAALRRKAKRLEACAVAVGCVGFPADLASFIAMPLLILGAAWFPEWRTPCLVLLLLGLVHGAAWRELAVRLRRAADDCRDAAGRLDRQHQARYGERASGTD